LVTTYERVKFQNAILDGVPTIQEINICTPCDLYGYWFAESADSSDGFAGFRHFQHLRSLRIPEWLVRPRSSGWGQAQLAASASRLTRFLPPTLQYLGIYTDFDPPPHLNNHDRNASYSYFNESREQTVWANLRTVIEEDGNNPTALTAATLSWRSRDIDLRWDLKWEWKGVWEHAGRLPHFESLQKVEYLHYGTEAYRQYRSRGRQDPPIHNGMNRSIVIWKR